MIKSLLDLPITGAYLRRIGAEPVHFHLATITEMVEGYPKPVGRVKFLEDGSTLSKGRAGKPTDEEAEGIRAEFADAEFPKIVPMSSIGEPPPKCDLNDPNTFIYHDFSGNVIMVHQRYENKDGTKGFLPWTKWSDGEWRLMEPDVMPFFGLPGANEHSTLFLHEGAKSAARVKRIIAGEEEVGSFPWLEEMRWGAHIGWIGGVHALDRSDWGKLAAMGWKKVIIIADNDDKGKRVVPEIAENFHTGTFALLFTESWPEGFDLGDDWPAKLFGPEGQYIGPTYSHCLQPATWATDEYEIPPESGNGKPKKVHTIRPNFASQWAWVEKQDQMINLIMPTYQVSAGHFNAFVRPFSHVKDTLSLFQIFYTGNQMELTYDPSVEGTIVRVSSGVQAINLYTPSAIRPAPGDWEMWETFLAHLFPVEKDRLSVKRWAATLIAKPSIKMIFGLLLMSEHQGVGKGTFARVLANLVGMHNASFPSASMIVDSQFNGWISGKRLIVVDEIYEGHSWKAYQKLKPYVTDSEIEINVKHIATWTMPNWTHYVLMSNSRAALKIEATDRRWLIPEVTEQPWSEEQFDRFYAWMKSGGYATIAMWAKTFEERGEGKYVRAGEVAPGTDNKVRLVAESRSETEELIDELGEAIRDFGEPVAVSLNGLKNWVAGRVSSGKVFETPQDMSRALQKWGLFPTKERIKIGTVKQTLIVNDHAMLEWEKPRLRTAVKNPDDLLGEPL